MSHESNGRSPFQRRVNPAVIASIASQSTAKNPLLDAYDELNAMWKAAEGELQALRVPVDVSIEVSGESFIGDSSDPEGVEYPLFGFVKYNDQWRICAGVYRDMFDDQSYWQWIPISESPIEKRVELAGRFAALRTKVIEARDNFIPKVSGAIATLKSALKQ